MKRILFTVQMALAAFLGLGLSSASALAPENLESDSLALVAIYQAADGANWSDNTGWLTDSLKNWVGVTVDNGRVTILGLNGINFGGNGGTLSPAIGKLTALTKFEIQEAPNLTGSIPAELWNCTNIGRLQIKYTGLTGGIPAGIQSMVNMYEINFQQTYLGGTIPAELYQLPALTKPYLHQSNFTGTVPATVSQATGLARLYLQENKLVGPLPFADIAAGNNAKVNLTGNFFTYDDVKPYHDAAANYASFTNDYQYARQMVDTMVANGASFTLHGTVAGAQAYAWFKEGTDAPLAGTADLSLANFSFDAEGTYICKAQSSAVANFDIRTVYNIKLNYTHLQRDSLALVDIYNAGNGTNWDSAANWLTAPIAQWEYITITDGRVTQMGLNQMNMGGTLSPSVGRLTALTRFEIQNAPNLTGSIPAELWNCTNIGRLQIKYTGLTGGIPAGIQSMVNMYEINFQQSYLGGTIPAEVFQLPSLQKAYLHQSNFTGTLPATVTEATGLTRFYVHDNKLQGPLPFVDLPATNGAKVNLTGNYFGFDDVKPYHDAAANITLTNDYQLAQDTVLMGTINGGEALNLSLTVEGGEMFNWFMNDGTTPLASAASYSIAALTAQDAGVYTCKVQSTAVANFQIIATFVVDSVHVTAIGSVQATAVSVAPNPAQGYLRVVADASIQHLSLSNLAGAQVLSQTAVNANQLSLSLAGLPQGIYVLTVIVDGQVHTQKLVIE